MITADLDSLTEAGNYVTVYYDSQDCTYMCIVLDIATTGAYSGIVSVVHAGDIEIIIPCPRDAENQTAVFYRGEIIDIV